MARRKTKIKILIQEYKDIFEPTVNERIDDLIKEDLPAIYLPYTPMNSVKEGLPLRDGVGFITIEEIFKNECVVEYIYRFTSTEYNYLFSRKAFESMSNGDYSFHYDKVENDIPHPPHITSIFPSIRWISKAISLEDFLSFIRTTFFKIENGKYIRKTGNLWDSRFV